MSKTDTNHSSCERGTWDRETADWYVTRWGEHPLHGAVPKLCRLSDGERVLDIGCGSGTVVREIAACLSAGEVLGIDPTPRMIELARKKSRGLEFPVPVRFVETAAERLPCPARSCDLVLAINSLHHWQDVAAGLAEVQRVLKPSGRFVVIDDLWEEIQRHIRDHHPEAQRDGHPHWLSPETITETLAAAGFSCTSREYRATEIAVSIITAHP
ncbi:class I SAM-dependent methyltransferase [Microbulbifer marinus]|uniref:Methyltransferase domain-containing protein n=1 Tax=Microbulbifer marinus TaxID=658218 RepID=A0A1H3X9J0_9GAMM|nr:class I SAM-dependent methyltransferase [Microbulbifer marinus]SDZ95953.1 Methyltransferase domain-containing protein [Microbulbifer marinus]